jgi:hypothetical protein
MRCNCGTGPVGEGLKVRWENIVFCRRSPCGGMINKFGEKILVVQQELSFESGEKF